MYLYLLILEVQNGTQFSGKLLFVSFGVSNQKGDDNGKGQADLGSKWVLCPDTPPLWASKSRGPGEKIPSGKRIQLDWAEWGELVQRAELPFQYSQEWDRQWEEAQ